VQPSLLLEFVVATFATGMIARVDEHTFVSDRDMLGGVNGYPVAATTAGAFGSFGHRRILSHGETADATRQNTFHNRLEQS
jgi:hypothetical protein